MVTIESKENCTGVKPMHTNGDLTFVFSGRAFLNHLDYLIGVTSMFAHRNIGWSLEVSTDIMTKALRVNRLIGDRALTPDVIETIVEDPTKAREIPSVILFRRENAQPGEYLGASAQRMFFITTEQQGEVPAFYHILRAFESRYRGRHRGRFAVELALMVHDQARVYIHRSSNPMALVTNTKSDSLVQEERYGIDLPYPRDSVAFAVAKEVVRITTGGRGTLLYSGVVRGIYPEPNTSFIPNPQYPLTFDFYQKMIRPKPEGGYGMDPSVDAILPSYRTK